MKPQATAPMPEPGYYPPPPPDYSPPAYSPPGHDQGVHMMNNPKNNQSPPPAGLRAPGAPSSASQPQPMIIYHANTTVTSAQFGPYPMRFTCPNCHAHVMTETHSTPGLLTYILSGALCVLAPYLLCCLVPCCVRECKDIEHRCPNCQYQLGLFKRI